MRPTENLTETAGGATAGNGDINTPKGSGRSVGPLLLILLTVGYGAVLVFGPVVAIFWGSFSQGALRLYEEISSPPALDALLLTLVLAGTATLVNTVFGVCVAWVLVRDRFPGRSLLNGLVDLPFAVSPVIAGLMLLLLFGREGWLEPVVQATGIRVAFAFPGILLATCFVSLPFVIRETMPLLTHIGTAHEEAAVTMGASRLQAFRFVTLPSIRWGLIYGIALTFARCLGEFGAVLVISGGVVGVTETSTLYIWRSLDDRNQVGAYAMALLLAVLSFSLIIGIETWKRRGDRTNR